MVAKGNLFVEGEPLPNEGRGEEETDTALLWLALLSAFSLYSETENAAHS